MVCWIRDVLYGTLTHSLISKAIVSTQLNSYILEHKLLGQIQSKKNNFGTAVSSPPPLTDTHFIQHSEPMQAINQDCVFVELSLCITIDNTGILSISAGDTEKT